MLNVNNQMQLPVIIERLKQADLYERPNNPVIASRFETLALLAQHIDDDKLWDIAFCAVEDFRKALNEWLTSNTHKAIDSESEPE